MKILIQNQSSVEVLVDDATNVWAVVPGGAVEIHAESVSVGTTNGMGEAASMVGSGCAVVRVPSSGVPVVEYSPGPWLAFMVGFGAALAMGGIAWGIRVVRKVLDGALSAPGDYASE